MVMAMDYEKLYKEALERAKKLYEQGTITESLSYVFTELAESEDERIIKAQLDYWRSVGGKEWHGVPVQETIAWLEKQGEKKSAWSEEDEVKVNRIVSYLENFNVSDNDILLKDVDWLKSLKQRMEQ